MTRDSLEVLSGFMDGEEPDASALAEALASPGAREALLDFVRLRGELARDPDAPPPSLRETVERELRVTSAPRRRLVIAGTAAALFVVAALGILVRDRTDATPPIAPPPAQREVRFTEGIDWFRP